MGRGATKDNATNNLLLLRERSQAATSSLRLTDREFFLLQTNPVFRSVNMCSDDHLPEDFDIEKVLTQNELYRIAKYTSGLLEKLTDGVVCGAAQHRLSAKMQFTCFYLPDAVRAPDIIQHMLERLHNKRPSSAARFALLYDQGSERFSRRTDWGTSGDMWLYGLSEVGITLLVYLSDDFRASLCSRFQGSELAALSRGATFELLRSASLGKQLVAELSDEYGFDHQAYIACDPVQPTDAL